MSIDRSAVARRLVLIVPRHIQGAYMDRLHTIENQPHDPIGVASYIVPFNAHWFLGVQHIRRFMTLNEQVS